jgi:long-chain fatty acid transport protein
MPRRWDLPLCGAAAVLALAAPASANEPDAYGFGSRSSAMGGAVVADATDFSANYYNPAGLASAPGVEISIGYMYAWNHLRINDRDTGVAPVHGLVGGLVAPGELFGVPFAFGIAVHMPDDGLSRVKALRQEVPRWEIYDNRASTLFLATNLAVRPFPFLEIGGGLAFLAATRGRFEISGTADILAPYDSQLRHEVDADLTSIRYPQAGLRVLFGSYGTLGVAYRGETKLQLELEAHLQGVVDFAGIAVPLEYELETRTIDAFLPQQVVIGLSFQKIENLHIDVDLTFVNWGAYESSTARTRAHLEAQPPPGTPLELPADPKPTQVIPPDFQDRFVPRIGVEYLWPVAGGMRHVAGRSRDRRLIEVPLRAGYVYEDSPVPPQTGFTNFVDATRHTFTIGTGLTLNAPIDELPGSIHLDIHGQLSVLPEITVEKTNPADFIGDYRAAGRMLSLGATMSAVF